MTKTMAQAAANKIMMEAASMSAAGAGNEAHDSSTDFGARSGQGLEASWVRVRSRLRAELGEDVFNSWFARVDFEGLSAGVVRLSVPTVFLKGWIKSHYDERLVQLWQAEDASVRRIDVSRRTALRAVAPAEAAAPAPVAQRPLTLVTPETPNERFAGSPVDAKLTFETFCEGRSNDLAYRAAHAVATAPEGSSPAYNPLYIHAGVGLGKTHLLQSIANECQRMDPNRRVLYLTVERFTVQFVSALRDRSALDFKEKLRGIDILLIDDMQFLTGKSVQQEFCHMLNALLDSSKQVVVVADRAPGDLEGVDERVRSRLKGGVVVGMAAPDSSMRRQILEKRFSAARDRNPSLAIPDPVLDYVAQAVATNGRDLDGALNRLICRAEFSDQPITMDIAELAISDLVGVREARRIKIEDIQKVVAGHYNVSKNDLLSARRTRTIVRPRQIAMYLAKTMTPRSFPEIGKRFGGRDHTTVLHAVRKVEELAAADEILAQEIELLKRLIQE
nr:chromosomal replication initiator protein DnaA [Faunimonas pinastri]